MGWGLGVIVSPLGGALNYLLGVSYSEGLRPEATAGGPTERAAEASREEGGSQRKPGGFLIRRK